MTKNTCVILNNRGLVAVSGSDARTFLQGIVSCDVHKVSPQTTVYGAFLTPQGKYLFDFFIAEQNGDLLLDIERDRIADFIKRLSLYKLRSDISLADVSDQYEIIALFGEKDLFSTLQLGTTPGATKPFGNGIICTDPRLVEAGARVIIPTSDGDTVTNSSDFSQSTQDAYDQHRISLSLPDSTQDLIAEKSTLLENGFDELNGVDWDKGCYMGQEVTARTKHRGLLKKRLVCVDIEGPPPKAGTPITYNDRTFGEMRSSSGNMGLALIKLDFFEEQGKTEAALNADNATITPRKPNWATF
ncbi:MAG: folate-binding protein YgfZ [Rhodospirillales bacterium]|jgi:tRNA-modifying protein YgfZ|nr:folate-binding protein YgfZ [Rhodospirillales bacterium]